MKKIVQIVFLACGLLLTLAAFPVFAQEEKVEINKMPFNNFVQIVKQKVDAGKIDLTESFSIELEGVLNKDGKLDAKKSKFTRSEGGTAMIEISKSFIEAVGDSGFFRHLKDLGIEKLNLTLVQDDNQIHASVVSEVETSQRAMTISSGLNMAAQIVRTKRDEMKNISDDEKILINGLKVSNDGKTLTIKVAYEKSVIQEMIKRKLKEIEVKQSSE